MGLVWRAAKMLDASWHVAWAAGTELAFIHASSSTVGYRPHVRSTTLAHLIATNGAPLMLPILPIRDRIRDKVEEAFGMQLGLLVEFTGIISWLPGATIGWHADDNRPYLKQRKFAAVCYLNEYDKDFDGGLFRFRQGHPHTVTPKPGRLVAYSASGENEHCLDPVIRGQRLTLTLWFTLNPSHSEDPSLLTLLSRIPLSLRPPFPRITLNLPLMGDVGPGKAPEAGKNAKVEAISEDRGIRDVVCGANQQQLAFDEVGKTGLGAPEGNEKEGSREDGGMEREEGNEAVLVPVPLVASDSLYLVQKEGQGKLGEWEDGEVEGGEPQEGSEAGKEGQREEEVDIRIQELASMGWKAVPFLRTNGNAMMQLPPGSDDAPLLEAESEWVVLIPSPGSTSGQEGEDRTSLDRIAAPFDLPQGLVRSSGDADTASLEDDFGLANPPAGSAEASDERREVAEGGGQAAGQQKKRKRQSAAGLGAGAVALPGRHLYHLPATSCNAVLVLVDA
ncbi:unnamed protein product [Closterium sp. Naga37s-1]|nr:unnamed protein product [Closterium sp. Naga37s-1]